MMKRWNVFLLAMLLLLGLTSCAPDSGVESSPSSSVSASDASSAPEPEVPSVDVSLSAPAVQEQEKDLLDALWTRLHADEWNEKCWMSGRNLIYFIRENGGYFYYAGTANSGVGGMRAIAAAEQVDQDTYRLSFSAKENAVQTFLFDEDVLPYLYLHFTEDQLEVTEVYPAYVAVSSDGEEQTFQCRLPSQDEKKNGEDRMRELSETETYYPASGEETELDTYTYQTLESALAANS